MFAYKEPLEIPPLRQEGRQRHRQHVQVSGGDMRLSSQLTDLHRCTDNVKDLRIGTARNKQVEETCDTML
jgi:hypothetical protein